MKYLLIVSVLPESPSAIMIEFPKAASSHMIRFPEATEVGNFLQIFLIWLTATFINLFIWLLSAFGKLHDNILLLKSFKPIGFELQNISRLW